MNFFKNKTTIPPTPAVRHVIFAGSSNNNDKIIFSDFKFVTRYSYGSNWFNGTNDVLGFVSKLTDSNWGGQAGGLGIDSIDLFFISIKINGILYDGEEAQLFSAIDYTDYTYRDDGYGLGFVSYIDQLNIILQNYQLRTRFYPALGNQIIGIINTAENFEVHFSEYVAGLNVQTDYSLKCEYGNVYDSFSGPGNYGGEWI